jgi:cbb3-type cytochrome oxidase maturation protein
MNVLAYLIPLSLVLGIVGLLAFLWCMRSGQFEDLDGAAERVLFDDDGPAAP